jgi:lysozyme
MILPEAHSKTVEQLKIDEGFRSLQYLDTVGVWTIGYGYNLEANPLRLSPSVIRNLKDTGISRELATELLNNMVQKTERLLCRAFPWIVKLDAARQAVLLNMAYNMGVSGLSKFTGTLQAVETGNYKLASVRMLQSKWAKQVGERAKRLATLMETGEFK